jgi:heat shock protein HtpX
MKRAALFIATNLAVLAVLTLVVHALGIDDWLANRGSSYQTLIIFAGVFGFGGAFISLLMSKWMAKRTTGMQIITQPRTNDEAWLLDTVRRQAETVGIGMPEVGIFESPAPNAFATGARRDEALVAVSTGLLRSMRRDEVEAVLAHEVSHIANGDMVTLTLLQGVLNTFVIFFARVIGGVIDSFLRSRNDDEESSQPQGGGMAYFIIVMVTEMVLALLASIIVMAFSRYREFRADAGGAQLAGRRSMIGALEALRRSQSPSPLPEPVRAFGISGGLVQGVQKLFMSHPPLEERIAALARAA